MSIQLNAALMILFVAAFVRTPLADNTHTRFGLRRLTCSTGIRSKGLRSLKKNLRLLTMQEIIRLV